MELKIVIDDAQAQRVIDGIAGKFGYTEQISDNVGGWLPNPETKAAFARRQIITFAKTTVIEYEKAVAANQVVDNLLIS